MSEWEYRRYNYDNSKEREYVAIVDENQYIIAKRVLGQDYPEQYTFIKDAHNKICKQYKKEIAELKAEINDKDNANTILIRELENLKRELNDWKVGSDHEAFYGDEARREIDELKTENDILRETIDIQIRERELVSDWTRSLRKRIIERTRLNNEVDAHTAVWRRMRELDAVNEMMDKVKKIVPKELRFCQDERICRETIFELCSALYTYEKDEK
jgi:hypothetical protein